MSLTSFMKLTMGLSSLIKRISIGQPRYDGGGMSAPRGWPVTAADIERYTYAKTSR